MSTRMRNVAGCAVCTGSHTKPTIPLCGFTTASVIARLSFSTGNYSPDTTARGRPQHSCGAPCGMSRDTFMRQFQDRLGRSAVELLTDSRMSLVVNGLKEPAMTVKVVAGSVGYRSVSVFRRVFTDRM